MTPNPMRWSDPYYIKALKEHPLLLAGDGIHPNQAGQALICRLLAEKLLKQVLRAAEETPSASR
jgi:lysophospholipase L1-like esterase